MISNRFVLAILILLLPACSPDAASDITGPGENQEDDEPVFRIEFIQGVLQEAPQRSVLPEEIRVRVTDAAGNPQEGVSLTASVEEGDAVFPLDEGEASTIIAETDEAGEAGFVARLGEDLNVRIEIIIDEEPDVKGEATAVATFAYLKPADTTDGWPTAMLRASDVSMRRFSDGIDAIRRGSYPETHSLLIVQRDSLRFEAYWPGRDSQGRMVDWNRTTPHEGQSSTKSFRSALVGIAIDQGFITGVDQEIRQIFPEYAAHFDATKSRITVEDVLTMSSGIEWDETGVASGGTDNSLSRMYARPGVEWSEYVLSLPAAYEPGTVYVYNTGASIMLGHIVQRASGMSLGSFVREFLQEPAEMTILPGVGYNVGATILPRDMARLGQIYLRRGMWKQTRIVSEDFVEDSFVERFQPGPGLGYGYQWWMRTLDSDIGSYRVRYASGNGGQFIIVIDELEAVIASTGGNFGLSRMNQIFPFVEYHVLPALESAK